MLKFSQWKTDVGDFETRGVSVADWVRGSLQGELGELF